VVSKRVDLVIIGTTWGSATLHLPAIWQCTHFSQLLHPGEMKPTTKGARVGRGAMGLQMLDASRGMSVSVGWSCRNERWIDVSAG
jgi:hypothetical protein